MNKQRRFKFKKGGGRLLSIAAGMHHFPDTRPDPPGARAEIFPPSKASSQAQSSRRRQLRGRSRHVTGVGLAFPLGSRRGITHPSCRESGSQRRRSGASESWRRSIALGRRGRAFFLTPPPFSNPNMSSSESSAHLGILPSSNTPPRSLG